MKSSEYYKILCTEVNLIRESIVDELVNEPDYDRSRMLTHELKAVYSLMQRFVDLNDKKIKDKNNE